MAVVSPGRSALISRTRTGSSPSAVGNPVHVHFDRELRLRRAEPAERAVGRRVRHRRAAADADVVAAIRTARVDHAARQDHGAQRRVGAAVEDRRRCPSPSAGHRASRRSDAGRSPGAASSSRACPRRGRRSASPAARPSARAAPRGRRSSTGILPCRQIRRRFRSGRRGPCRRADPSRTFSARWT